MNPRRGSRDLFGRIARLAVAAGLTAYILYKSHPRDVVAAAAGADWRLIAIAVLIVLVDRALMAYRWVRLLCIVGPAARPPLAEIMRIFFVTTFVGSFLPATVGGDALRAYSVSRLPGRNVKGGDAIASVFMDRMLGVASVLIMALVGLMLARDLAREWTILAALAFSAAACAVTLLVIFSEAAASVASSAIEWLPEMARGAGHGVLASVRRYSSYHGELVYVLACSVAVQVLRIVQAYYLGRSLGIVAPIEAYFAFIPMILLVMLLPVTINGFGTGQLAFVWFFARAGVPRAPTFALSVLFIALGLIGNLPGGILYASGRGDRPELARQPSGMSE